MKVLILGASGGTGRELVRQALEKGHDVTAFVRNPERLKLRNARLRVVQGNILDPESLAGVIEGQDAVISALGTSSLGKSSEISEGVANVIRVMVEKGIKRLIFETTVGLGDSRDYPPWVARRFFFPVVLKNVLADKMVQEKLIRESTLDWTIVRPGRLTNGAARGKYRIGDEISEKARSKSISRADVADFMLKQVTDGTYLRKTPAVSY